MRKKEIGSEFWDIPVTDYDNGIFSVKTQWFVSGRSALKAIIQDVKGCRSVAMPSWCCDSMIKPFMDAGFEVRFYPVYWQGGLVQEIRQDCDVLFIMDYFGYSTSSKANTDGYSGIIIRDLTHSLFSATCSDADYYFGSLRKWCGVSTGGYLWTKDGRTLPVDNEADQEYVRLRKQAMRMKKYYIENEKEIDKSFLQFFAEAEDRLEDIGIEAADKQDTLMAKKLDVQLIRERRRSNAEILRKAFCEWLIFPDMSDTDCPMFVPVMVPNGQRDALRKDLIEKEIYCPVHWPISDYHKLGSIEEVIYKNELSLICDQRYSADDMERIVDCVKQFMGAR